MITPLVFFLTVNGTSVYINVQKQNQSLQPSPFSASEVITYKLHFFKSDCIVSGKGELMHTTSINLKLNDLPPFKKSKLMYGWITHLLT